MAVESIVITKVYKIFAKICSRLSISSSAIRRLDESEGDPVTIGSCWLRIQRREIMPCDS
jgi:hypothetical protein